MDAENDSPRAAASPRRLFGLLWRAAVCVLGSASALPAQQPTPAQVQALLQRPGSADSVRARIKASGLTPEQIRARLRQGGYDPRLLDAYLTEPQATGDQRLTEDQIDALRSLYPAPPSATITSVDTGLRRSPERPASGVFGVDVFRRTTTQFMPLLSGPVPADYRLGPGDMVVLILTGNVELTYQLTLTREGFVVIPQVGQVYLANLTLAEARNVLYDRLGRVYAGVRRGADATTQFDVSVSNVRAIQVYVVGEVAQPGAYQLSALSTVLAALYTAGGVTERANPRTVAVRRGAATVATFDLYDYLLKGNTRSDIRLENGDVVYVGLGGRRASVLGSVRRPAAYDLIDKETLADLIDAAGGLTAEATRTRISIERIVPPSQRTSGGPQRVTLDVSLPPGSTVIPPLPIEDGDSVRVFGVSVTERNFVDIEGSVYLPGKFGFEPGLRLSGLIARAGGLQPGTFAGRAHIARMGQADLIRRIIAVPLPRDSLAPWTVDPALQDQDSVIIYNRLEMRPALTVSIAGAVNDSATVAWRDGMSLRDLILAARGLAPGAWLMAAEIARLPGDRSQGQMAISLRVPLDSTYLFDRDSAGTSIGPPGLGFRPSGAPEVPLLPWDRVTIFRQPEFDYQRTVSIGGQVYFPGEYSLLTRSERLSKLIARAGGLTGRAYPKGVQFFRQTDSVGRLDVNLPEAMARPGSTQDIMLLAGDRIEIPEYQPSVRIEGAVNSPGSVLWESGKRLSYYLGAAGGVADNGNRGRARVRQANGKIETRQGGFLFFSGKDPIPEPGSIVSVPVKPERPPRDNTTLIAAIATMLASTASVLVALLR